MSERETLRGIGPRADAAIIAAEVIHPDETGALYLAALQASARLHAHAQKTHNRKLERFAARALASLLEVRPR